MKLINRVIKAGLAKTLSLMLLSTVFGLTACSEVETDQQVDFTGWEKAYLIYSYPFDGQQNVSIKTKISLMFTHDIEDEYLQSHVQVIDKDQNPIAGTITHQVGTESGLSFTSDEPLLAGESYTVVYTGVTSSIGEVANAKGINFSTVGVSVNTASNPEDPAAQNSTDPFSLNVIREFPSDDLPFMDFSVIHLTFNQPLDLSTVALNGGFKFTESGQTQSVAGKLIVKDRYIIFDPEVDLSPGIEYTLSLASSIKSRSGIALTVGDYSAKIYVANDSHPRSTLVQRIHGEAGENISPLSGIERNTVPVYSALMGDVISYADADYHTELAFIPNFPEAVPFVIRRGSVVKGTKMPVNIGGQVPAGFDTGEIYLTLITDATGYLVSNENTNSPDAPKQVRMVLDVAMTAQDPRANGGLSQDVLHIDLFGIGITENGVLVVDTLGEINPTLLGVEKANGLVSFFLEAYADQHNAPIKVIDTIAPELQTWLPDNNIAQVDPADAVLLIFTEPLQPENLSEQITLTRNGNEAVPVVITHDGSAVIVKPLSPLKFNSEYIVSIGADIKDISGNTIEAPLLKSFTTLNYDTNGKAAPLVGAIYPGYGCKLIDSDLENNIAGRCEGGLESDDEFNIFKLPSNRHVQITFNKLMDTDTFSLGENCDEGSIRVEEINNAGECQAAVSGSIHFDGSRLSFESTIPYQADTLYRLTLHSAVSSVCDGSDNVICSTEALPLRTIPLTMTVENRHQGSGPMTMPFVAVAPENNKVFNPLSQLPSGDVNRNFTYDSIEDAVMENATKLSISGTGGLINSATMGCESGSCTDKEYIYVSGYLPTDVGLYEALNDRIPVDLYSQVLMTTSVTMYAKTLLGTLENPTGPQIMRMRNRIDEQGNSIPGIGYILWDETEQQAMFQSTMNVYLDAPGLKPEILGLELETNLHSYPLTIELYGPVTFLPDGRMNIELKNMNQVDIDVAVGSSSNVDLKIYPNDLSISLVSKMVKS
jgi:methionine-rich copper-binding protein CopC